LLNQVGKMKEESLFEKINKNRIPYLFILPFYILFAIFMLYPILNSFYLSFNQWNGVGPKIYVGLQNYINLFKDRVFIKSLINIVIIFFEYVPAMTLLALILAELLNSEYIRLRNVFRTIIFLPYVTASVAIAYSFQSILDKDYGLLSFFLGWFGVEPIALLNYPILAQICLAILVTWRWLGYNMVILLAGLQNIPPELYEASKIDGATATQSFFCITLPLMKPMLLFVIILSTIGTFSLFNEVYILTRGGPMNATLTPVVYLYNVGFKHLHFGYASSIAYVLTIILIILGVFWIKILEEKS